VPGSLLLMTLALAAAAATDETLDTVVVVASRTPEPISQVAASVTQVAREDLDRHLVRDPAGLVRYVPGVAVITDANRFGTRGFAIRGLDGNRVRILVDGIPLADDYSIGQFASAGRDLVDLEAIEQVEIQRGPASTLYGSDALAGVVAFRTRDPDDLLSKGKGAQQVGLRAGADSVDDSPMLAASWAGDLAEGWQGMALVAQRRGHEGANRAWRPEDGPNPADYRRENMLAKLVRDAGEWGRYTLTLDAGRDARQTAVNSLRFGTGRFATTYRLDADDTQERTRASLAGEWTPARPWLQSLSAQAYGQSTDIRQDSWQYRLPDRATPFESLRWRRFDYSANAFGLSIVGQAHHEAALAVQRHVFGVDVTATRYEGLRDGLETNLLTGAASPLILGEFMPVRDFPNSTVESAALYWQDEISLGARFALVAGVRAEWNRVRAHPDAIYLEDYPDSGPVDIDTRQVTPRLAARWTVGGGHVLTAQYARGFRAPPFGDVNIGLTLPIYNYEVRANPDLRPERSEGVELGWRHVGPGARASVSLYENRYRDLIESRVNLGVDPATQTLVFQSVNRARARIRGVEADLLWRLPVVHGRADRWQLRGAFSWSEGDDTRLERPLNSIEPPRTTWGLQYEGAARNWGAEAAIIAAWRKERIDRADTAQFATPGYTRFDLYGWLEPLPGLQVNVALLNVADRRYWEWSAVRGVDATDDNLGFYTQPGRSIAASIGYTW